MTAAAARPAAPTSAVAMLVGSCISLQIGAALASRLFDRAGSNGTTLLRLGMAAAVLLLVVRPDVRGWSRDQWRGVALLGLSVAIMNACFYAAIARIPLGAAVTIEFLGPLALAAATTRRGRDWLWVVMALAGVLILGVGEGGAGAGLDAVGVAWAAVAGVFWACYILAGRTVGVAVPGQSGLAVAAAIGALVMLPLGAGGAAAALTDGRFVVLALATGVLASVVPYSLELNAMRRIPPQTFGVLLSMEPAIAALAGWALLSQHIGPLGALGIVVVVVASIGATAAASRDAASTRAERARGERPLVVEALGA